jgi:hypothetical protein
MREPIRRAENLKFDPFLLILMRGKKFIAPNNGSFATDLRDFKLNLAPTREQRQEKGANVRQNS